jgi:hypothetical protein
MKSWHESTLFKYCISRSWVVSVFRISTIIMALVYTGRLFKFAAARVAFTSHRAQYIIQASSVVEVVSI